MIDWSRGYSSQYYMTVVDKSTWRDIFRVKILSGSINRTDSDLRESADVECVNYSEANLNRQLVSRGRSSTSEQYIRIWLDAKQDDSSSHIPLFTGLASSPTKDIDGFRINTNVQCYSILKPAQDVLLPRGWYAPVGINGYELVKELLGVTGAPIIFSGEGTALKQAIIAESNENNLSMAYKILDAMTRRIKLSGDGTINIMPYATNPIVTFDSTSNDILEKKVTLNNDWYNCPNVFRAVVDDSCAIARDESDESPYSIQNRGREIWVEETNCNLNENESPSEYAQRRLKELQKVNTELSYDRRYWPDLNVTDIAMINYPSIHVTGKFLITNQTINLGYGATTSEEAVLV